MVLDLWTTWRDPNPCDESAHKTPQAPHLEGSLKSQRWSWRSDGQTANSGFTFTDTEDKGGTGSLQRERWVWGGLLRGKRGQWACKPQLSGGGLSNAQ